MDDDKAELIAEQMRQFQDNIVARMDRIDQTISHNRELDTEQMSNLRAQVADLKTDISDHETRIRSNTDSAVGFRLWTSGASLTALIAIIRSFFP